MPLTLRALRETRAVGIRIHVRDAQRETRTDADARIVALRFRRASAVDAGFDGDASVAVRQTQTPADAHQSGMRHRHDALRVDLEHVTARGAPAQPARRAAVAEIERAFEGQTFAVGRIDRRAVEADADRRRIGDRHAYVGIFREARQLLVIVDRRAFPHAGDERGLRRAERFLESAAYADSAVR